MAQQRRIVGFDFAKDLWLNSWKEVLRLRGRQQLRVPQGGQRSEPGLWFVVRM